MDVIARSYLPSWLSCETLYAVSRLSREMLYVVSEPSHETPCVVLLHGHAVLDGALVGLLIGGVVQMLAHVPQHFGQRISCNKLKNCLLSRFGVRIGWLVGVFTLGWDGVNRQTLQTLQMTAGGKR